MLTVAAALLPGLVLQALLLDPVGVGLNVLAAGTAALITDRFCLILRRQPDFRWNARSLSGSDAGALVTALLLAAALPPGAALPVAFATTVALALGKHAYGGLGNNVFNPAMVGYAIVLVSMPLAVANWPAVGAADTDALTGATVLTTFKYRGAATVDGVWTDAAGFGLFAGAGYEWIALAYAAGAVWLFHRRIAAWRPAAGVLTALLVAALLGYDNGSSASLGSPVYHLFAGGLLLAVGFVVTDPVTHPSGYRAQWLFGLCVGLLIFSIRAWGNYPDGIAFAVLLGNALTPYLDHRLPAPGSTHA
jgi:electron transport complex protein RnfD